MEYTLLPPKDLPANDYQVALTVFYEAADGFKSTTFFNQTITVNEKPQLIDWKLIFLYVIFIGLVAAGGESVVLVRNRHHAGMGNVDDKATEHEASMVVVTRARRGDLGALGAPTTSSQGGAGRPSAM